MTEQQAQIYESIIRDMSEGVMTVSLGGVIESINPAAEKILGVKREDALGSRYVKIFFRNSENDEFNQSVLDAMQHPGTRHEKIVSWHNGGETRQLYMVTSILFREDKKIGTIIVFNDITELAELKQRYVQDIEALLDSLVKALSTAVDERSHYTGKHTQNMVAMAETFLDWMNANGNPWQYDDDLRREFLMSVWMHDIGKLTVPLEIMDKSTRLGTGLQDVQERFRCMRLLNRIAALEGRISAEEFEKRQNEQEEILAFVTRVNTIGFLPDEDLSRLLSLSSRTFEDEDGAVRRMLTDEEIAMLSVRKGTLTADERKIMQGHASSTWNILNQVHFPARSADVPMWAASHHEFLNAAGYPSGLSGENIPREVQLLTILDILEALIATDRPYKPPVPLEKVWTILESMVREGCLNGELLSLFRESLAWKTIVSN